jgi:hypothetical protein
MALATVEKKEIINRKKDTTKELLNKLIDDSLINFVSNIKTVINDKKKTK